MADNSLKWAQAHFSQYQHKYELYDEYYNGNHYTYQVLKEFRRILPDINSIMLEYVENLCPCIVDTFADGLQIEEFNSDNPAAEEFIAEYWKHSRMDNVSGAIHNNALLYGDAYVSVWFDENGSPIIRTEDSGNVAVRYDDEQENIIEAVKAWNTADGKLRVTRYLPDRIERYISKADTSIVPESLSELCQYNADGLAVVPNKYNRVPIFRWRNSNKNSKFACSELKPVVPIQDALNESVLHLLIGLKMNAFPIYYLLGAAQDIDPNTGQPKPIKVGPGSFLQILSEQAKIGRLEPADLSKFLEVQDAFTAKIARVSRTPMHYLLPPSGQFPSGESQRVAEAPLLGKIRDRQLSWGDVWEDVMSFVCEIAGIAPGYIECQWIDPTPHSALEEAQTEKTRTEAALNRKQVGMSDAMNLQMLGMSEEEIAENQDTLQVERSMMTDRMLQAAQSPDGLSII